MNDKTYNGWSNYETWRVNLEIFDGANWNDYYVGSFPEPYDLSLALKEHATEILELEGAKGLTLDYAMAFLDAVDWYEIALHLIINYAVENNQPIDSKVFIEANS